MKLSAPMVENVVTMLGWSPQGQTVARMLDGVALPDEYGLVAERCTAYWREHKQPPGVHTADLFSDLFERKGDPSAAPVRYILSSMQQIKDGINEQFVISRISEFLRLSAMRTAVVDLATVLGRADDEATLIEAEGMVANLLRARRVEFDPGLTLQDTQAFIDYLHSGPGIRLDIEPLDRVNVLPQRGTLMCVIAVTGQGKTWWLVHCGKQALNQRLRVVPLQPGDFRPRRARALLPSPVRASEHQVRHVVTDMEQDSQRRVANLHTRYIDPEFAFRSEDGVNVDLGHELSARLRQLGGKAANLRIRAWPPRVATIDGIEAYLDTLADAHFEPDLILVDYPQLMKLNVRDYRLELGQTVEHLRRIAIERHLAMVMVHQSTRAGAKSKSVGMTHVAEDWSVVQTADFVLSYSATLSEQRLHLARLHIDKARVPSAVGKTMILTQNYDIGQYALTPC